MGITCSSARSMACRRSRRRLRRRPRRRPPSPPPPSPPLSLSIPSLSRTAASSPILVSSSSSLLLSVVSSPLARLTEADAFRTTSRLSCRVSSPLIYCRGITSEAGQTDRWPEPGGREGARPRPDPVTFGICVFKTVPTPPPRTSSSNRGYDRKREKGAPIYIYTLPRAWWAGRWRWSN